MINGYDFDKTIYNGDSSVDFYMFCLKKNKKVLLMLPIQIYGLILYVLGIIEKTKFKEYVFSFLKKIDNVDSYVKEFWKLNEKKIKDWYLSQKEKTDIIVVILFITDLFPLLGGRPFQISVQPGR